MSSTNQILLLPQPTSPVHDELDALSMFEIGRIDISCVLDDDSSLDVKVKLQSISLDDVRENSTLAIKRYALPVDNILQL